jgi:hypothetical protein
MEPDTGAVGKLSATGRFAYSRLAPKERHQTGLYDYGGRP